MSNPKLSVVASNRDRLQVGHVTSDFFLKSIQWQTYTDFELVIADGGSSNYEELKKHLEEHDGPIKMRIVQHEIGEAFLRSFLNNLGVRHSLGDYVMTTDVDMLFGKDFMKTLMATVTPNTFVDSRTMYWKSAFVNKIHKGELDPYNSIEDCKRGRIKKRTSAGGCQCMHIDNWHKVRGFDERYEGWGSEDQDLITRVKKAGIKIEWMGENRDDIMLFHQPHAKKDIKRDLEYQEENKKLLANINGYKVNPDGWGGKDEKL